MTDSRTTNPPMPKIGVGGLLFNKNQEILLIKRGQAPAVGLWSLPGGKLEPGESMVAALNREFLEETGLEVDVQHIVAVVDRQIEGFHYVIVDFCVTLTDEKLSVPSPQADVTDARWVSLVALGQYELVIGLEAIILAAHANLENKLAVGLQDTNATGTDFIVPIPG